MLTVFALSRVPVVLAVFAAAWRHYRRKSVSLTAFPALLLPLAGLLITTAGDLSGNWFRACFVFGAAHLTNQGATLWSSAAIAVEAGLLLGAAFKFRGTLWLPIAIHWAWNYTQGNILGFAVSGEQVDEKLFSPIITGADWITGGAFGAEASVPAVVVGLLLTVILLYKCKRDER